MLLLIMGVTATGKSTLGKALAVQLGFGYIEAINYYPASALAKMRAGYLPDNEDMDAFLDEISNRILFYLSRGQSIILDDSCIRKQYRDELRTRVDNDMLIILLEGEKELILERTMGRSDSFFDVGLLERQVYFLEPPQKNEKHHRFNIDQTFEELLKKVTQAIEDEQKEQQEDKEKQDHKRGDDAKTEFDEEPITLK